MQYLTKMSALLVVIALLAASCQKESTQTTTIRNLYQTYKNGSIDECQYQGSTVYCAGLNVYDASALVYDASGKKIATCNYAWGGVDSLCTKLTACKTVYRCHNSITGQPFVDTYGLSR